MPNNQNKQKKNNPKHHKYPAIRWLTLVTGKQNQIPHFKPVELERWVRAGVP